jgi:hypothetical protein
MQLLKGKFRFFDTYEEALAFIAHNDPSCAEPQAESSPD